MEKKKFDFSAFASDARKNASAFIDKTKETVVRAVDQNDDGTFDLKDVTAIAESIGNSAKNTAAAIKESAEARSLENERKQLQPLFVDDINGVGFSLPKFIRITDIDKKRAESEACRGSIGFKSTEKDLAIVNIFKNSVEAFGLSFFPDTDCECYYIDPTDRDHYIAINEYFKYLKIMRVNELERIAQDLGAKHFRVTIVEKQASSLLNAVKAKSTAKTVGTADADHGHTATETTKLSIAAESIFPGHAPIQPTLKYLAKDPTVQHLIDLRMGEGSLTHRTFTIEFSNTTGMKEKDALKIDAAIKAMKISSCISVASEVKRETNRFFEYEIEF